ncbi:50S ribosomal protein L29 [Candidatus Woesearchaeota archaeon]|nr:50S ribosomal protein L29 [Candidatus Woesearchaeota archaeon]
MKKRDLKGQSTEELKEKLAELRLELIKANSQVASGSAPKNPGQIRQMRKTIARILTFIHHKTEATHKDG